MATKSGSKLARVMCALRASGRQTASEVRRKRKSKDGDGGESEDEIEDILIAVGSEGRMGV